MSVAPHDSRPGEGPDVTVEGDLAGALLALIDKVTEIEERLEAITTHDLVRLRTALDQIRSAVGSGDADGENT